MRGARQRSLYIALPRYPPQSTLETPTRADTEPMQLVRVRSVLLVAAAVVVAAIVAGVAPARSNPRLSVQDARVVEGRSGGTVLRFVVGLSGSPSGRVTVRYSTADRTATAPSDYSAASGTLTLDRRHRTRTVAVRVVPDPLEEKTETLALVLTGATGAVFRDRSAVGTIVDDDGPPVIAAAGDIACSPTSAYYNRGVGAELNCRQRATSDLLARGGYDAVLTLGDNQYERGELADYEAVYDRSWGRVKAITHPTPGNHEYMSGAGGYFRYFGAAAGDAASGWYSFDLGSWHVIALNSNCAQVGGCWDGSPQERWLRNDLARHAGAKCTLAFWHEPRFSSGAHGDNVAYTELWRALYEAGADVVLAGHDHDYERFAPQAPSGVLDTGRGIREFVVGTGGSHLRPFGAIREWSEVRDATSVGILELRLRRDGYDWRFRPAVGSFTDAGSGPCH